jgi:hypothetical protein
LEGDVNSRDEVDPKELDGDEGFGHAQQNGKEDPEAKGITSVTCVSSGCIKKEVLTRRPLRCLTRSGIG